MKKCNICQILSSELLLSNIYSCICLMLTIILLSWTFLQNFLLKKLNSLKSGIFVQQLELSVLVSVCMIHFYCIGIVFQHSVFSKVPFWWKPSAGKELLWFQMLDALHWWLDKIQHLIFNLALLCHPDWLLGQVLERKQEFLGSRSQQDRFSICIIVTCDVCAASCSVTICL